MLQTLAPWGTAMLVHSLSKTKLPFRALMSKKRLAHNIFNTFASHVSLICDITDTDCWAQNDSSHGHVFTTFKHWFLATRMRNREIKLKTAVCFIVYFYYSFLSIGHVILLQFSFPLNHFNQLYVSLFYCNRENVNFVIQNYHYT